MIAEEIPSRRTCSAHRGGRRRRGSRITFGTAKRAAQRDFRTEQKNAAPDCGARHIESDEAGHAVAGLAGEEPGFVPDFRGILALHVLDEAAYGILVHESYGAAAETGSRHPRTEASFLGARGIGKRIKLDAGDLVIVTERGVRFLESRRTAHRFQILCRQCGEGKACPTRQCLDEHQPDDDLFWSGVWRDRHG